MDNIQTLKGFRDFLPEQAQKRQYVINILRDVFESYGFSPLETPVLEYEEILTGKYGDEGDKLMYRFEDNGGRKVAMRYDQTVPLARVVAQYGSASSPQGQPILPMPFKRYQIQNVWRAENTQKGRFREFLQCDIDTVGSNNPLSDAEILAIISDCYEALGFKNFKILINDRTIFAGLPQKAIIAIDKLKKIGEEKVQEELKALGLPTSTLESITKAPLTQNLEAILKTAKNLGIPDDRIQFEPTLARGLDYYTGIIIEVEVDGYTVGSVGGGGRYDNLIGMFTKTQIPAVGFAFGFDRVMEAMEEQKLFPENRSSTRVLVTIFSPKFMERSIEVCYLLRAKGIASELYLDESAKMDKQLKYADQKAIPYAVIIGSEEIDTDTVTLKNLKTREQKRGTLQELLNEIK